MVGDVLDAYTGFLPNLSLHSFFDAFAGLDKAC